MTTEQHLLICMAEECSEVAQRISKALRFGIDEVQPGQSLTNAERIMVEFDDLVAVVRLLQGRALLPGSVANRIHEKHEKLARFMAYAREQGALDKDHPMTPEQQQQCIKLAEFEGWTDIREQDYCEAHVNPYEGPVLQFWQGVSPDGETGELPTYTTLDDCQRLERLMTDEQHEEFRFQLKAAIIRKVGIIRYALNSNQRERAYISADWSQRMQAICRTFRLQIETE